MATYSFPTAAELLEIERDKLPRLTAARPVFDIMPIVPRNTDLVMWEQLDNYGGLQQLRGINGLPPSVGWVGGKRYQETPGYYGEHKLIDEVQLTMRASWGSLNPAPISIDDLVTEAQDHLLERRLDRVEQIIWDLLVTGTFSVSLRNGAVGHTGTYPVQTYAASDWSTHSTATPVYDFGQVQLLSRGHNLNFGPQAKGYMNQITYNNLLSNLNLNDLFGRRPVAALDSRAALTNQVFLGEGLPGLVVYDAGYLDDTLTFRPFIPDDKVVVVGVRSSGAPVGEYQMTRNAQNTPVGPGPYTRVIDRGETTIPRIIEVHDGHNGGPALFWPSAIVVMSV